MMNQDKTEFLASIRRILFGVAEWLDFIVAPGAGCRLLELPGSELPDPYGRNDYPPVNPPQFPWGEPGCLGSTVEDSLMLKNASALFDFAVTGIWDGDPDSDLLDAQHDLIPLAELVHQPGLCDPEGGTLPDAALAVVNEFLQLISARIKLHKGGDLTLAEVALLAGLSEKTVRMAAIGRDRDPELRTRHENNRTWVDAEEALRWLSGKKGFRPNVFLGATYPDPFEPRSLTELQDYLRHLRAQASKAIDELAGTLGWSPEQTDAYAALETARGDIDATHLTVKQFVGLGRLYGLTLPETFARSSALLLAPLLIDQQLRAVSA